LTLRWTAAGVVVAVIAVIVAIVIAVSGGGATNISTAPAPAEGTLEAVDVVVSNGPDIEKKPAALDVKLHNKGSHRVVLTRAELRLERVGRLTFCSPRAIYRLAISTGFGCQTEPEPSRRL
jgi:hypothetical protein